MTFVDVFQYVGYMRKHSADAVRNIFRRACEVHLPKKSSMHLAWAAFEETQGGFLLTVPISWQEQSFSVGHFEFIGVLENGSLQLKTTQTYTDSSYNLSAGNMAAVAKIFDKLDKAVPGLVVTSLRRIGVARRQSNSDATLELYRKFATESTKPEEKAFFSIKYARYLAKVRPQCITI